MKQDISKINLLCISCWRKCKQPAFALVASCPKYNPLPRDLRSTWKQMDLPLGRKS